MFAIAKLVTLCMLFAWVSQIAKAKFIDNLSYDDLSSTLRQGPTMLIFTVSWCPHCKEVLPEIGVLAKAVKKSDGITVARVDGDSEPAIVTKFQVESFPTFLYFPSNFDLKQMKQQPELQPQEFSDYRWAELMAEFVNNETMSETVKIEPRKKFLDWRKKVPFNKGKRPRQIREEIPTPTPHPDGLDPIIGADEAGLEIRDPVVLTSSNFDDVVLNKTEGVVVYFYTKNDFMQKDFLIQWRQASSAYKPEDHVTLAMMNIENGDNENIAKRYEIDETPFIAYFPRCNGHDKEMKNIEECKKPNACESCTDTDTIIDFVSEQMMLQAGLTPGGTAKDGDDVVTLTAEEYERLVKEGKIIPMDPNNPDQAIEDHHEESESLVDEDENETQMNAEKDEL